jgi:hypothetical protein
MIIFIIPEDVLDYLRTHKKEQTYSFACTYCGDRFNMRADRAVHEKEKHVDNDGNLLELTCDLCQEKLPSPEQFRRHCIDKHKRNNYTLVKLKTFCCDECGKTFKVKYIHNS